MIFARETRTLQARDLPAFEQEYHKAGHHQITVRIAGQWREVFDVWTDDDDPSSVFGDCEYATQIGKWLNFSSPCWVVVRYVVEEKSTHSEIADGLHRWRTCDLVEVQVPVAIEITCRR